MKVYLYAPNINQWKALNIFLAKQPFDNGKILVASNWYEVGNISLGFRKS